MIIFSIDCMSITEPVTTTTSFDADRKMEGELFKYKDMSLCVYLLNNLCFLQQIAIISKRFRNFAVKNAKFFDLKVQSVALQSDKLEQARLVSHLITTFLPLMMNRPLAG